MGVKVRLDNGISGFIPTKMISDKHITSAEDRCKVGAVQMIKIITPIFFNNY